MITLDDIRRPVAEELKAYNEFIESQFSVEGGLLCEMLNYALTSRGKGIRPLLVVLAAKLNAEFEGASLGRRTSLAAMLVEMIHVASLIHDDVIDESDTRRGRPSVNARWQSNKAVILGDYVLARNLSVGLQSGQFDLISHTCGAIATLCEGEIEQAEHADNQKMSRKDYFDIIYKKTACLLGVSASAGALAVRATRDKVTSMRRFGEALGMAFQIQDDLLDYQPDNHTGKPAGNDLKEGKVTLPLLVILEKSDEKKVSELKALLKKCHQDEQAVETLRRIVVEEGGLEEAAKIRDEYIIRAMSMLSDYDPTPERKAMADLCTYIVQRDR